VNACGSTSRSASRPSPTAAPNTSPKVDHPAGRRPRGHRVAGPEQPADQGLRGDRDRVEGESEGVPQLEGDLVRADLGRAEPGRHRGRSGQRQPQRDGPDQQVEADPGQPADHPADRPQPDLQHDRLPAEPGQVDRDRAHCTSTVDAADAPTP
jgi:hypothetical protein